MTETAGQRIRRRRKELGIKQGELAAKAEIGQSTLSEIERGESKLPNAENLRKLAQALDCSDVWILYGTEGELQYPSEEESRILSHLRRMTAEDRRAIYQIIKTMPIKKG